MSDAATPRPVPARSFTTGGQGRRTVAVTWSITDQALSSLTNLLGSVLVARAGGPGVYGAFALATAVHYTVLGFQRSFISIPLTVTSSARPEAAMRSSAARAFTATAVFGLIAAGVVAAAGAFAPGLVGRALRAIAPWLPMLILQDFWRTVLFMTGRPRAAALNDASWALGMALALPLVLLTDTLTPLLASWALGGACGALVGFAQIRLAPASPVVGWRWWWRDARSCGTWFGLDHVAYSLVVHGTTFILAMVGGAFVLGGIRAVHVLLAPIGVLSAGGAAVGLPEFVRTAANDEQRARRHGNAASVALVGVSILWGGALVGPARNALPWVFGQDFNSYTEALLPLAIGQIFVASGFGIDLYLNATARAKLRLIARLATAVVSLPLLAVWTLAFGLSGAAWGIAMSSAVGAIAVRVAWNLPRR